MVGPDDPFRPSQIRYCLTNLAELPVNNGFWLQRRAIEQHVLRTEIAVHQYAAICYLIRRADIELMKSAAGAAHSEEHVIGTLFQDLLTRHTWHEAEHDRRFILAEQSGDRKAASEKCQRFDLVLAPHYGIRPEVALDHLAALEACGICVAVRQPLRFFASGAHRSKLRPSPTAKYTAANIPVCSKVA